jgi:integrase
MLPPPCAGIVSPVVGWCASSVPPLHDQWLRGLKLSTKTKRNIRGLLSVLWDFAAKKEHVPLTARNPVELVRLRRQPGERRRLPVKDLSAEQFQQLLGALDPMLQTLFTLQLSLGLRISEVLGLKWKDIDWFGKSINLERGVVAQIVDDVKTEASRRGMPVSDDLLELLKQWKAVS